MAIVTVAELKEQLNLTADFGTGDDALLGRKIAAAQGHVERLLGFKIEDTYGGEGQEEIPPALAEAVCQLAAHWYEQREAAIAGVAMMAIPFGVEQIVNEYREWTFG